MPKSILDNQKGMSLVEVTVAAAVSIIIAMGVLKINETSQKGMRSVEEKSELITFRNTFKGILLNRDKCTGITWNKSAPNYWLAGGTGTGTPPNAANTPLAYQSVASISNISGKSITVGSDLPWTNMWRTTEVHLYRQDNAGNCHIMVTAEKKALAKQQGFGGETKVSWFSIACSLNANGSLNSCSGTDSVAEGYFQENSGGSDGIITGNVPVIIGTDPETTSAMLFVGGAGANAWSQVGSVNLGIQIPDNYVMAFGGAENMGVWFDGTSLRLGDSDAEALRISENGYLTIDPVAPNMGDTDVLNVDGNIQLDANHKLYQSSGTGYISVESGDQSIRLHGNTHGTWPDSIDFRTSGSQRMFINGSGSIGIGTTSPTSGISLDVRGNIQAYGGAGSPSSRLVVGSWGGTHWNMYKDNDDNFRLARDGWDYALKYVRTSNAFQINTTGSDGEPEFQVNNSGNVGIGIGSTAPGSKLEIASSGADELRLVETSANSAAQIKFYSPGSDWDIGADSNPDGFYIHQVGGSQDALFINTSNYVGIGNKSPNDRLHVSGNIRTDNGSYLFYNGIDIKGQLSYYNDASAENAIKISNGDTNTLANGLVPYVSVGSNYTRITNTLAVSNYVKVTNDLYANGLWEYSDKRYKKKIKKLERVSERLEDIKGVTYFMRREDFPKRNFSKRRQIGLIAQNVEKVFPELVHTDKHGYKSVSYQNFVAVLIEAFKEQRVEIEKNREMFEVMKNGLDKKNSEQDERILELENENKALQEELRAIRERLDAIETMLRSK